MSLVYQELWGGGSPYDNFLRGYRGAKPPFMLENALMFE